MPPTESGEALARRGFSGVQVCKLVGITYRQLDYWATTGLATPSIQVERGPGVYRVYSFEDLVQLRLIKKLLDAGMYLQRVREAITYLRQVGSDLDDVTLISDGKTIFACRSEQEVLDLLRRGQGVFGIAINPIREELQAALDKADVARSSSHPRK